jgi:hypothetical protein
VAEAKIVEAKTCHDVTTRVNIGESLNVTDLVWQSPCSHSSTNQPAKEASHDDEHAVR